ncbi:CBS domain-containing protein [Candidatus Woesearchaeota archaeon]|jgi:CBS domain-containing protein|nr:CBS domain-containing protein [Candidatus Woesearchaeota archaeon]|tara:strand:+ start:3246 stop:3665 length:420 start_codon:yes stop_codon:yes gene_type:complete
MKVKEIMHMADRVDSNVSISEAAKLMEQKLIGSILAEENNEVIGIMTERDILKKVVAKGKNPDEVKVKNIMNHPVLTIDANQDIVEASRIMDRKRIRRLIVTENDKIIGKVTANSISRNLKFYLARKSLISNEYVRPEY